jgi:hypothetical protein
VVCWTVGLDIPWSLTVLKNGATFIVGSLLIDNRS